MISDIEFMNLTTRANDKDVEAMTVLHNFYFNENNFIDMSYDEDFIEHYEREAIENKPYSLYHLSQIYMFGLGVPKDMEKCMELLDKSFDCECSQAYYLLANLYQQDIVNSEKYRDFFGLLQKAKDLGNANAYLILAANYENKNKGRSIRYYLKAIELNHQIGYLSLGEYYHDNSIYKLARKYYRLGSKEKCAGCFFNLAVMYREGEGLEVDWSHALKLFKRSHRLGNKKACACIGDIYERLGKFSVAKRYYKMGIKKSDPMSHYRLGRIYMDEFRTKKALQLFIAGGKLGDEKCTNIVIRYGLHLDAEDKEINQCITLSKIFHNFGAFDIY